jgi:hypothetical protein
LGTQKISVPKTLFVTMNALRVVLGILGSVAVIHSIHASWNKILVEIYLSIFQGL